MTRRRGSIRSDETRRHIDRTEPTRPIGTLMDGSAALVLIAPMPETDALVSMRRHVLERMTDVEDGKLLAEALGIRWRDIGDWPEEER